MGKFTCIKITFLCRIHKMCKHMHICFSSFDYKCTQFSVYCDYNVSGLSYLIFQFGHEAL